MTSKSFYLHRKDLLGLGLKSSHITCLVSRTPDSTIFSDLVKQHGCPSEYSMLHCVLIYVGCQLYSLGFSHRHVVSALEYLDNFLRGERYMEDSYCRVPRLNFVIYGDSEYQLIKELRLGRLKELNLKALVNIKLSDIILLFRERPISP